MLETPFIRTQNPCDRCTRREECGPFIRRLAAVVAAELRLHPKGYELPQVIVDCEGRFSPPARTLPLRLPRSSLYTPRRRR